MNGAFAYRAATAVDAGVARKVRDSMASRGPDGSGEWQSPGGHVWLGHRRLAIIDLSPAGAQPMLSDDGGIALTYNGEIYNFNELREDLKAKGCLFRSVSDTEVIIHLYSREGPAFVSRLRGMFAFALWDERRQLLLAARDPYGIKPFFYSDTAGTFAFASQVKALLVDPAVARRHDPAGVTGFLLFGSVPEPWTIYHGIRSLPAGSTLIVDRHGVQPPRPYHSVSAIIRAAEDEGAAASTEEPRETLREALLDSVRHHLVADVPVGAFLSAGVDSGALVGLMRDAGQNVIRTVTLAYDEFREGANDESPLAAEVARRYATAHVTRHVSAEEFHTDLPKILAAMDQPTVDGINSWFVSKAASELGLKVAISGVGGDELLGGYSTFKSLPRLVRLARLVPGLQAFSGLAERGISAARRMGLALHPKWAGLLRYGGDVSGAYLLQRGLFLPTELGDVLAEPEFIRRGLDELQPRQLLEDVLIDGPRTLFGQVAALESCLYLRNQLLRDTDWAGMAHSLEIRTPLVDHVLLRRAVTVMSAPSRPDGKALLADAPLSPLPSAVRRRRKTGFGIPVESWLAKADIDGPVAGAGGVFSRDWARRIAVLHGMLPGVGQPAIAGRSDGF